MSAPVVKSLNSTQEYFQAQTRGATFVSSVFARPGLAITSAHTLLRELNTGLVEGTGAARKFVPTKALTGHLTGVANGIVSFLTELEKKSDRTTASIRYRTSNLNTLESFLVTLLGRNAKVRKGKDLRPVPATIQTFMREKAGRAFAEFFIKYARNPETVTRLVGVMALCGLRPSCQKHLAAQLSSTNISAEDSIRHFVRRISESDAKFPSLVGASCRYAELLVSGITKKDQGRVAQLKTVAGETFMELARAHGQRAQILLEVAERLGNSEAKAVLAKVAEKAVPLVRERTFRLPERSNSILVRGYSKHTARPGA